MVQDELQTVKRLLASEEADKKRLADQVAVLTEAVDGLRQSFASAPPDASPAAGDAASEHEAPRDQRNALQAQQGEELAIPVHDDQVELDHDLIFLFEHDGLAQPAWLMSRGKSVPGFFGTGPSVFAFVSCECNQLN